MKKSNLFSATITIIATMSITSFAGEWTPAGPTWSYVKDDGSIASNEWITDGGKSYHLDPNGIMDTGWILDNGKWYYLNGSGDMCVNRLLPNGKYLGPDGVWISDYVPQDDTSDDSSDSSSNSSSSSGSQDHDYSLDDGYTEGPLD